MDACARLFRKRSFGWNRRAANRLAQREARGVTSEFFRFCAPGPPGRKEKQKRRGQPGGPSSVFPLGSIPSVITPCALLATSPGIPLPFQSRAPPHPPGVLVFRQKLRFRNTRTCRHGIAWRGDQTKRFVFTLPAVQPGRGFGGSQVVPAPRQSLRRRAGVRTKGDTLS